MSSDRPNGAEEVSILCLGVSKAPFLTRYICHYTPSFPSSSLPNAHLQSPFSALLSRSPLSINGVSTEKSNGGPKT